MLTATWVVTMAVLAVAFVLDNAVLTFAGVALGVVCALGVAALRVGGVSPNPDDYR